MRTTISFLSGLLLFALPAVESSSQTFIRNFPDADVGPSVLGVASSTTLYVGGLFENLMVRDGVGIIVNTSGTQTSTHQYGDKVYTSIPDGAGGFFVAGESTWIDDDARSRIARINANGTINTTFNPPIIDGPVRALALVGGNLFAGGEFATVDGSSRSRLARFNATTGALDATFNVAVTGGSVPKVLTIATNDAESAIFIGGDFTTVGGLARSNIAKINLSPIAVNTTYTAGTNGTVNVIKVSSNNNSLFIGGNFDLVGVKNRDFIAKVDESNGVAPNTWVSNANGVVHDIDLITDGIITCGEFTQIGGKNRNRMAKLDASDGNVRSGFVIAGTVNNTIYTMTEAESGSNDWFVAGAFTTFDGVTRNFLAKVDGTGDVMTWNPGSSTFTEMRTVAFDPSFSSTGVFCGGRDDSPIASAHMGKIVSNVAVFPETECTTPPHATGFAFRSVTGSSRALAVGPDATFFNGGVNRGHFAEWTIGGSMAATQFRPVFGTGGKFWDIALNGDVAIVVGEFSQLERHDGTSWGGTVTRNNIAAIDLAAAPIAFTAFDPNANGVIRDVVVSGGTAFVAGSFTTIGGVSRAGVAAIDLATGSVTAWDPNPSPSGSVEAIAISGSTVFLGGSFTSIGGASRSNVAAVDNTNGTALAGWNPGANGTVYALTVDGGNIYAGGSFTTFGGSARNRAAVLSTTTAVLDGWNPNLNNAVFDIAIFNNQVVLAGSFTSILNRFRNGLAAVTRAPGGAPKSVSLRSGSAEGVAAGTIAAIPNPMRGSTAIEFTVPRDGRTVIELYSSLGARIREIFADDMEGGGRYSITLERDGLPPGVYLLRMMSGGEQIVERVVITE